MLSLGAPTHLKEMGSRDIDIKTGLKKITCYFLNVMASEMWVIRKVCRWPLEMLIFTQWKGLMILILIEHVYRCAHLTQM